MAIITGTMVAGNDALDYAVIEFDPQKVQPVNNVKGFEIDGIGRFDLEGGRIKRYSEVFDRGMALAQQAFEPERLRKIELKYATALKARPEWQGHVK